MSSVLEAVRCNDPEWQGGGDGGEPPDFEPGGGGGKGVRFLSALAVIVFGFAFGFAFSAVATRFLRDGSPARQPALVARSEQARPVRSPAGAADSARGLDPLASAGLTDAPETPPLRKLTDPANVAPKPPVAPAPANPSNAANAGKEEKAVAGKPAVDKPLDALAAAGLKDAPAEAPLRKLTEQRPLVQANDPTDVRPDGMLASADGPVVAKGTEDASAEKEPTVAEGSAAEGAADTLAADSDAEADAAPGSGELPDAAGNDLEAVAAAGVSDAPEFADAPEAADAIDAEVAGTDSGDADAVEPDGDAVAASTAPGADEFGAAGEPGFGAGVGGRLGFVQGPVVGAGTAKDAEEKELSLAEVLAQTVREEWERRVLGIGDKAVGSRDSGSLLAGVVADGVVVVDGVETAGGGSPLIRGSGSDAADGSADGAGSAGQEAGEVAADDAAILDAGLFEPVAMDEDDFEVSAERLSAIGAGDDGAKRADSDAETAAIEDPDAEFLLPLEDEETAEPGVVADSEFNAGLAASVDSAGALAAGFGADDDAPEKDATAASAGADAVASSDTSEKDIAGDPGTPSPESPGVSVPSRRDLNMAMADLQGHSAASAKSAVETAEAIVDAGKAAAEAQVYPPGFDPTDTPLGDGPDALASAGVGEAAKKPDAVVTDKLAKAAAATAPKAEPLKPDLAKAPAATAPTVKNPKAAPEKSDSIAVAAAESVRETAAETMGPALPPNFKPRPRPIVPARASAPIKVKPMVAAADSKSGAARPDAAKPATARPAAVKPVVPAEPIVLAKAAPAETATPAPAKASTPKPAAVIPEAPKPVIAAPAVPIPPVIARAQPVEPASGVRPAGLHPGKSQPGKSQPGKSPAPERELIASPPRPDTRDGGGMASIPKPEQAASATGRTGGKAARLENRRAERPLVKPPSGAPVLKPAPAAPGMVASVPRPAAVPIAAPPAVPPAAPKAAGKALIAPPSGSPTGAPNAPSAGQAALPPLPASPPGAAGRATPGVHPAAAFGRPGAPIQPDPVPPIGRPVPTRPPAKPLVAPPKGPAVPPVVAARRPETIPPPEALPPGQRAAAAELANNSAQDNGLLTEPPEGAPEISIMFIQYRREPGKSLVSLRVGGAGMAVAREGDYVDSVQVASIHPEGVDVTWTGRTYRVSVSPF